MKPPFLWTILAAAAFLCLVTHGSAGPGEILLDDYADGLDPGWQKKIFSGETSYTVVREDDRPCIKAVSSNAASGLIYKIKYDPGNFPFLSWEWKVDHVLERGDARSKETDDYAARVYVVFPSIFFWRTKALNYIWANRLPRGTIIPNSYTANAVMIAVESGPEKTGAWHTETRNIYEDYRISFGGPPPRVGAVAIMTDTDNTGEEAIAWYGAIRILQAESD